jgi:hypothetical protein
MHAPLTIVGLWVVGVVGEKGSYLILKSQVFGTEIYVHTAFLAVDKL